MDENTEFSPSSESTSASSSTEGTKANITKDLEQMTMDFSEAINTRNFDIASKAWQIYGEDFVDNSPSLQRPKTITLTELHTQIVQTSQYFPDFQVNFFDLSTVLNSNLDRATVFFRTVLTNAPPGVTKQGMSTVEYRWDLEKERWFCVKQTNLAGEDYVGIWGDEKSCQ